MNLLACLCPALGDASGRMLRASLLQKRLGAEESHIPQHTAKRWPWGPGSPSPRLAALLCVRLLQCGVQLSPHPTPRLGYSQEPAPSSQPSFLSTPQVPAGLFTKRSCVLSSD